MVEWKQCNPPWLGHCSRPAYYKRHVRRFDATVASSFTSRHVRFWIGLVLLGACIYGRKLRAQGRYSAITKAIGTRMADGNGGMHALQAPPADWVSPWVSPSIRAAAAASQHLLHSGCLLSSMVTKFFSNLFLHTVRPLCKSSAISPSLEAGTVLIKTLFQSLGRVTAAPSLGPIAVDAARRPAVVVIVADDACFTEFLLMRTTSA
jgi:hypothetical protein